MAPERLPFRALSHLEPVHDLAVLVDTVLKMVSKYSFISNKLRFFGHFRLVSPKFAKIVNWFLEVVHVLGMLSFIHFNSSRLNLWRKTHPD